MAVATPVPLLSAPRQTIVGEHRQHGLLAAVATKYRETDYPVIDVYLLGTGAMQPLPDRWLSSLIVRCRGELTLFDCGEGTQIPLRRSGWGFRAIGAICFSHWHADHIAGLPGLLHGIANANRSEPVAIYGPVGIAEKITGLRTIAPDLPYRVDVCELTDGASIALPGGFTGAVLPGQHRVPSLIYRVDIGRGRRFIAERAIALNVPRTLWKRLQAGESVTWASGSARPDDVMGPPRRGLAFGFVTDTRPLPTMPDFLAGVDLLVCEGTYGDSADRDKAIARGHMTFAEAAELARAADVDALWLTHFSPKLDDPASFRDRAASIFPKVTIGESGLTTRLTFRDGE